MPVVIDCSVMVALCFEEVQSGVAATALDLVKTDGGIVPAFW